VSIGTLLDTDAMYAITFPDGFASYSGSTCSIVSPITQTMSCSFTYYADGYIETVTLSNPCPNQC
jgi:hypothetical protein